MRWLLLPLLLLPGCGPNRQVDQGTVKITAVETVPTHTFMINSDSKK